MTDNTQTQIGPVGTGSPRSRRLGFLALLALAILLVFGLIISPPDVNQRDAVRLFYIHVPSILVAYGGFFLTMVASIMYLKNNTVFWDLLAGAAGEIGVLFCAFGLFTGAMWGKPTWGVYWQWDPRLTSTTVMFVMYIGYLAVRRLELPPEVRRRRAAVLGIVSILNVIIVHYSVSWWRGLHQGQTLGDDQIEGATILFSFFAGLVAFFLIAGWLLVHRFRVLWLEYEIDQQGLEVALTERRAEGEGEDLAGSVN